MIQMIINGQALDLFKNEVFALSKAISKLGEFDLRHGDVSIKYKLPITNKNAAILGYVTNINNQNKTVFKRLEGELRQDESVLSSGFFQVLKINPRESIEVRFYGGNSEWFDLINDRDINISYQNTSGNPNLKSYDLSYLNHVFETSVIVSSWDNEDDYFYFPTDNGQNFDKSNNLFNVTDFQCGIFQHTIVKNIFDSIGVKVEGSLLNDPLYYNTLLNQPLDLSEIKNDKKRFKQVDNVKIEKDVYQPLVYSLNDQDEQWSGSVFTSYYISPNLDIDISHETKDYDPGQLSFNLGDLTIKCEYTIGGIAQTPIEKTLTIDSQGSYVGGVRKTFFNLESFNFSNVVVGDTFVFSIKNTLNTAPPLLDEGYWYTLQNTAYFQYNFPGRSINTLIPSINQADFIKDVMFRHGVISQFETKTRTLTLNKLQDIENNKGVAVDYSNKIDLSKAPSYDFTKILNGFKKTSKVTYAQDDNDLQMRAFNAQYKTNLGDAVISIDNDNLSGEGVVFESKFAGTLTGQSFLENLGNQNLIENFYIPVCRYMLPIAGEDNKWEAQEMKPRLFVKAGKIPVQDFSLTGAFGIGLGSVLYLDVGYAYFAKQSIGTDLDKLQDTLSFDNINYSTTNYNGTTLLQKNYGLYTSILNNPIHLSINLNLKPLDIQQLDFMKPIWLINSYYYINNVSQYKGDGTTTKIELVKI